MPVANFKIDQGVTCIRKTPLSALALFFVYQEEGALLSEMEFTGQAFEEMQEQNTRQMQQLREKDDANLKLMSEVILLR